MTLYLAVKQAHMICAALSLGGFIVRGYWMITGSPRLRAMWVRTVPHVVDTLLLASAVALALWLRQYPGTHAWLTAKLTALLGYIVVGSIALKRGRTRRIRIVAWVGALLIFIYIVGVAVTKNPFSWSAII